MKRIVTLLSLLFVCSLSLRLTAADTKPEPAKWSLESSTFSMTAGDTIWVKVKLQLLDGWHTYGLKPYINADGVGPETTEFTIDDKDLRLIKNRIRTSKAIVMYDSSFEVQVEEFKKKADFTVPISCSKALKAGVHTFNIVVRSQLCTEQNCLPAKEYKLALKVDVKANANAGKAELNPENTPGSSDPTTNTASTTSSTEVGGSLGSSSAAPQSGAQVDKKSSADAAASTASSGSDGAEVPKSMLALILLAMGFGASSWVMPCVYPMIPITVSFFTKRSDKEKTKPIIDSLVYSAGIMSTYIVFGAIAAIILGPAAGRNFAANPWVNLFLGGLFIIIAGNLFGMYELALPASLVNTLNKKSNEKSGYSASFIMGMVFSLTAFTCTVPFIDLVGKISAGGEWFRPVLGMFFYALIFALPFFLLALFPSALNKLPKSGAWMNNIKVVFGFVEVAFALSYFARTDSLTGWGIISREVVLSVWAACSFLIMLYILGVFRMQLDGHVDHVGGLRAILAVTFAALSFYIFDGIKSDSIGPLEAFVYVESAHAGKESGGSIQSTSSNSNAGTKNDVYNGEWIDDLNQGMKLAKQLGRPVFVDFTGKSCTNCRWMEKNMFPKTEIKTLMQKMILVRAFTDRSYVAQDKIYQEMQEKRFNSTLLPLYVLLTPDDKFIASSTYTPDLNVFVDFLKKASVVSASQTSLFELEPTH